MKITTKPQIIKLSGTVQHYDWGGTTYIPTLIGAENPDDQPFAELWMGDHPGAPAKAILPEGVIPLHHLFEAAPAWLGKNLIAQFGHRLPYLFKVLDVRSMLSIQVHPNKAAAVAGFREENEAGVPLNSSTRNFKDDNHKPEIMVALTDFWLLHGFREAATTNTILHETPELLFLIPIWESEGIAAAYRYVMEMPQAEVDSRLAPLHKRLASAPPQEKHHPDFWAWRAMISFQPASGLYDRGIFSIYLFNLVYLQAGEAIFQGAGIPHAYLEGVNVELMANSDNVFRGGLTNKHIDVALLLKHINFEPVIPNILNGVKRSDVETVFPTPAPDFELSSITLGTQQAHTAVSACGPHIFIVLDGAVVVNEELPFRRGDCFLIPEGQHYRISAQESGKLYMAGINSGQSQP